MRFFLMHMLKDRGLQKNFYLYIDEFNVARKRTRIFGRPLPGACSTCTEHWNTGTSRNIPEHPKKLEHPRKKTGTTPKNPEHPPKNPEHLPKNPEHLFLPASRSLSSLAGTNSNYKQNKDIFSFSFEALKMQDTH